MHENPLEALPPDQLEALMHCALIASLVPGVTHDEENGFYFNGEYWEPLINGTHSLDLFHAMKFNCLNHEDGMVIGREGVSMIIPVKNQALRKNAFMLGTFLAAAKVGSLMIDKEIQISFEGCNE